MKREQILIVGGGFAGLFATLWLEKLGCPLPVVLIDRNPYFIFKPLLYELLSEEVSQEQACPQYEDILANGAASFMQEEVVSLDLINRQVKLASGSTEPYQHLVLALGNCDARDQVAGAAEYAFAFRSPNDVCRLREHLKSTLYQAVKTDARQARQMLLTVIIVGAGRNGIELAATLADLLPNWYEALGGSPKEIRIVLLHSDSSILPNLEPELREQVSSVLNTKRVTIDIELEAIAEAISPTSVKYRQHGVAMQLPTATTLWAAGSKTNPLIQHLSVASTHQDECQRPYLTAALQLIQFPDVFAGGDCAVNVHDPQLATAQIAHQQGKAIAQNIMNRIENRPVEPYKIASKGTLLKVGLEESLVNIFNTITLSGQVGHFIRRTAYLGLLPEPKNPLTLNTQWIADDITSQFDWP